MSDTGFGHLAAALSMKTKQGIIHPSALGSFSGILVDQQKFDCISVPQVSKVPVLEFRVSDSRAHYLGWGTGSSSWFYSLPATMESNLNNYIHKELEKSGGWEKGEWEGVTNTAGKEINWGNGPEVTGGHPWLLRDLC